MPKDHQKNSPCVAEDRNSVMDAALLNGFSRLDLWNADVGIARRVAEAWAHTAAPEDALHPTTPIEVVLAGLRYDTDDTTTPAPLAAGIRALPDLVAATGSDVMDRIAQLLDLHARYASTCPVDTDPDTHRAQTRAVARDIRVIAKAIANVNIPAKSQMAAFEASAAWLEQRLPVLWD